jgi:hypothetical protein
LLAGIGPVGLRKELLMFNRNDKIIIRDEDCFYFGRKATVVCATDWDCVWQVRLGDEGADVVSGVFMMMNQKHMELSQ